MHNLNNLYKRKVRFLSIAIIIVLLLIIFLAIMGRGSCDECRINFENTEVSGMKLEKPIVLQVTVNDLYSEIMDKKCLIKWDRVQGYYE